MAHHGWKFGFVALTLLGFACDLARSKDTRTLTEVALLDSAEACGEASVELIAGQNIDVGEVTVYNDETTVCVAFTTEGDWYMTETHLAIATDPVGIPQMNGNPIPGQFPLHHEDLWTQHDVFCVLLADIGAEPGDPLYIATHAAVAQEIEGEIVGGETAWGQGHDFPGGNWGMYFEYVPSTCDEDGGGGDGDDPCGYRTQTQGGWGSICDGDNAGCYRDAHFDAAFPDGLAVGCGDLHATLLSSAAVERALPAEGAPRALLPGEAVAYDGSDADPTVGTVLFGQVVALSLSVAFDAFDDFKQVDTPVPLADLVIADPESPCAGMSVGEVLVAANAALGGCPAALSASELSDCAAKINQAYVDGKAEVCSGTLEIPTPTPIPG
ncbi:hypothetical protein [Nannocystis pusilla]|uniref:Lipoprotein n=1 Tax=Nannocystis pusilla TaxID=889268 RepID=A0ABS7TKS9_9BACT|nr:hypothetical protein [Nannocystis pusilla]MBZ5708838.1 hypothetical protein [Nannocystis pusilla]